MQTDHVSPSAPTEKCLRRLRASVVVTGKNVERHIQPCLAAIIDQHGASEFEIIYTDGGSSDKTLGLVTDISESSEIPLILASIEPGRTIAYSRNVGLGLASGEIIAFVDADCVLPENWLSFVLHRFNEAGDVQKGALGGGYLPDRASSLMNRLIYFSLSTLVGSGGSSQFRYVTEEKSTKSLPGGNVAYRKEVLTSIGSFDPRLSYCEDYELNDRLIRRGFMVLAEPGLYSVHRREYTLFSLPGSMFKYGQGRAELIRTVGFRMLNAQPFLLLAILAVLPIVSIILAGLPHVSWVLLLLSIAAVTYLGLELRTYPVLSRKEKAVVCLLWPMTPALIILSDIGYAVGFVIGLVRPKRGARESKSDSFNTD